MAYPTVSKPYGFIPINSIDGKPYAGATRLMPLTSVASGIYYGDLVTIATGGTVSRLGGANAAVTSGAPVGVFLGCQYVNTQGQTVQAQWYPGNAAASNAYAYVVDDPMVLLKVAVASSGAITTVGQNAVGTNMSFHTGVPSNATGDSGAYVVAGSGMNTATLPIRVIAVVPETSPSAGAYCEVLVKLNTHQYNSTTGNDLA